MSLLTPRNALICPACGWVGHEDWAFWKLLQHSIISADPDDCCPAEYDDPRCPDCGRYVTSASAEEIETKETDDAPE